MNKPIIHISTHQRMPCNDASLFRRNVIIWIAFRSNNVVYIFLKLYKRRLTYIWYYQMNIILNKEYLSITIHTVNPSITFLVFSRNICIIGLNFGFSICDNGYKTCQKVLIMATWNDEARAICTVGLLCNLEIPLWIISKTCFRHKPLRNFTVICQLDRKYYIPQDLTFCKAIKHISLVSYEMPCSK